ncbi:MAG: glycosyltransferase [Burkholderiales bacterium]
MAWIFIAGLALLLWLVILGLPWRPWSTAEQLEVATAADSPDLGDITALIPARNEAATIARTLVALNTQGRGLSVIVVDDASSDSTAQATLDAGIRNLSVLTSAPLPAGWTGKLWALEQGRKHVCTRFTLLLDADIELAPGILVALRDKLDKQSIGLASLMAAPRFDGIWEKLLMPAFVYFFKLLYPFALSNRPHNPVAAAAGGCILLETRLIEDIGGFGAMRNALIDDCTLARHVKHLGVATWVGVTHAAVMLRNYRLREIWNMVARTAFTQLRYSPLLLAMCSVCLVTAFIVPFVGLVWGDNPAKFLCIGALTAMLMTYRPTIRYYGLSAAWVTALPLAATLYLAMTWSSAWRYWRGQHSSWKGRAYPAVSRTASGDALPKL